jgi:hypothetical protein
MCADSFFVEYVRDNFEVEINGTVLLQNVCVC